MRVRIDRTPPVVNYTPVGSYAGFTTAANYTDDSIVNHSSMVILPDVYTGDVNFMVTTPDADVESMVLQWRWAIDPVGLWRPASEFFQRDGPGERRVRLRAEPRTSERRRSRTTSGGCTLENFADAARCKTGRMEFRGLATDEAGNTNALQTTWAQYTADNIAADRLRLERRHRHQPDRGRQHGQLRDLRPGRA